MLGAAIIGFGPLFVTAVVAYLVALPGLIWSPFAALVIRRMAQRRGLDRNRQALIGAASSVFLLIPWILLFVALRRPHLPVLVVKLTLILLYTVWLLGPIVAWGQWVAGVGWLMTLGLGGGLSEDLKPVHPILAYGVLAAMVIAWVVSGVLSWKAWDSHRNVAVGDLVTFRYITPFALTWGCTLFFYLYLFLFLN